jgi:glycosyltransferase involved in cell wall biosynthesis
MGSTAVINKSFDLGEPKVSIVIPSFRMGRFLPASLGSIGNQTYKNWELIVVDDCGPEDGTATSVANFADRFGANRVVYLRNDTNQGVSKSRNIAIENSTGEFVAFLDADDFWETTFLETCVSRHRQEPELDVISTAVEVFGDKVDMPRTMGLTSFERLHFPHSMSIGNPIQPSAVLVRRSLLQKVGGFTACDHIKQINEDWDLWIRLVEAGGRFGFIPEPLSRYRVHDQNATADSSKTSRYIGILIDHHRAWFDVNQLRYLKAMSCEIELLRQQTARLERPSIRLILKLDQWISRLLKPLFRAKR